MDSQCAYCSPSVRTTLEEATLVPLRGGQLPRDGIHEQRPIRPVAPPTRKVFPNGLTLTQDKPHSPSQGRPFPEIPRTRTIPAGNGGLGLSKPEGRSLTR